MDITELKRTQLEQVAQHREELKKHPHLRWLFFEITDRCNLSCRHCGSNCTAEGQLLSKENVQAVLDTITDDRPAICLTGGEPMMHPDFFEIAGLIRQNGFAWGMTTNATLIDDAAADKLKEAGMSTVSVSLDGMEQAHDDLRQCQGVWKKAIRGIEALQKAGFRPQVTTVFHQGNLSDIDSLFELLSEMNVASWRPINVEPIGRACESGNMMLTPQQFAGLLSYIRDKRFDRNCSMEVTFGCSHYLGTDYERMARDHYFLCGAGILTASVRSNGDICACLDIENRPELVQGNIREDNFMDVWLNRFQCFRSDRTADSSSCGVCPERFICGGDSGHTWNYDSNEPLLCYKDYGQYLGNVSENIDKGTGISMGEILSRIEDKDGRLTSEMLFEPDMLFTRELRQCSNCGTITDDKSVNCPACGVRISDFYTFLSDPIEWTDRYNSVQDDIEAELERIYPKEKRGFGSCHSIWRARKRLLREMGIDWKTPNEMNPGVMFD